MDIQLLYVHYGINEVNYEHLSWNNSTEHSLNNYAQSIPATGLTNSSMQQGMVSEPLFTMKNTLLWITFCCQCFASLGFDTHWYLVKPLIRNSVSTDQANQNVPTHKVMQLNHMEDITTIGAMEKALRSGNYSVVLGWLPEISEQDFASLAIRSSKAVLSV
ncbi:SulA-like leucine-rich domain-containing protein [Providencia hangzhouensis]